VCFAQREWFFHFHFLSVGNPSKLSDERGRAARVNYKTKYNFSLGTVLFLFSGLVRVLRLPSFRFICFGSLPGVRLNTRARERPHTHTHTHTHTFTTTRWYFCVPRRPGIKIYTTTTTTRLAKKTQLSLTAFFRAVFGANNIIRTPYSPSPACTHTHTDDRSHNSNAHPLRGRPA